MNRILYKMFQFVVLTALVASALGAPRIKSPLPQLDGRIVGGVAVDIGDYPYQLSLQYYGSHICGASVISDRFAVTAAHCTDGSGASALSVRAGSSIRGSGGQVVNVAAIHQNPQYDSYNIDYDISVLELSGSLNIGSNIQPVGLPSSGSDVAAGTSSTVSGWGTTSEGGSLPSQLQAVTVPIVSRSECKSAYGASSVTQRMVCAGVPEGGKDSCQGDSGGPLVANGQLVGVVSWGYGCARPGYPGVYSNVGELRDYITQVSGI